MMGFLQRMINRGRRPILPAAAPGSNIYPSPSQWGAIDLPNPSANTVAGLPAANRAKLLISNAVAAMSPPQLWTSDGFIADEVPTLITRPNSLYGTFEFYQMIIDQAIMHGNFLSIKADFDSNGYAQQLVPVPWGFWLAYYDGDGFLVYNVAGEEYSRDEVFHIRANATANQPMGTGVVSMFRRALGRALDEQNYAADTYRSGSVPAGTITLDKPEIDVAQANIVVNQWIANHSGGRAPAVLPNTMKFEPVSWSPADMQFLAQEEHTIGEVAHMFNLDPTDLGAALQGASMTYANIEQRQQQRIVDSYTPWMRKIEEEFSDNVPGGNTVKLVPANLLRTDSKTLAEVEQLEIANETLTVDEARKLRGKKPLPKPPATTACPTCGVQVPNSAMPAHAALHAAASPSAPAPGGPPGAVNAAGPADGAVLADAPQPVPDDPNLTQTPVKVKV